MPITFANEAQRVTYEKVAAMMKEEFGRQCVVAEAQALFWLKSGSARTQVYVEPIGESGSYVRALSWVVTGPEITTELLRYLLQMNVTVRFGAFGVDTDGDVMFTHAIHGESLTHEALMYSVYGVGQVADDTDDEIVQRFGGQRAVDRS